jgi:hypothetical protein
MRLDLRSGRFLFALMLSPFPLYVGVISLNSSTKIWIGQVTTGHGFMVIAPTLLATLSGTMSWRVAFPLLVAGVVGLAWPENPALKDAAQTVAADLEKVYAQYSNNTVAVAANAPLPPDPRRTAAGIAILAAIGLSLTACSGQTPAQQAAELRAVECIADTAAKIAAVAAAPVFGIAEAAAAVTTAGNTLSTDPACGAALVKP